MRSPEFCPTSKIIVVIAPGPAINGMARGKTAGSGPSSSSAVFSRRGVRRSNSMSMAVRNSRMPPDTRKAGMPMPIFESTNSPPIPNTARIAAPVTNALNATPRRWREVMPVVRVTNNGVRPIGSMITKRVTNAVVASSSSINPEPLAFLALPSTTLLHVPAHRSLQHASFATC